MNRNSLLPQRIEAVPSAAPATRKQLGWCDTERDAFLGSMALCKLTYAEIGARCGVSKQAVGKWSRVGVPADRVKAFCNATGTSLLMQWIEACRHDRELAGKLREADRVFNIVRSAA